MDKVRAPKILIVEDEHITAMDIRSRLLSLGYTVAATLSSGEEAVASIAELCPDLVLMDIVLKGRTDGVEAARQIRALVDIPVIYLTAFSDNSTLQRAKITEPFGYLLKPFDERDLHTTIEMALHKHSMEKRFRMIVEGTGAGYFRIGVEGMFEDVNEEWLKMHGYSSKEEVVGRHFSITQVAADVKRAQDVVEMVSRGEVIRNGEFSRRCKDGSVGYHSFSVQPVWHHGAIAGLEGFLIDTTERKRAVEALKEREFWLMESQRAARIGTYRFDMKEGTWICTEVLDDIFGIESLYDKTVSGWLDIIHPDQREGMFTYLQHTVVEKRAPFDKEYRILRKSDQQERWVHGRGELILDEDGNPEALIGTVQDITERKQREETVSRLQKAVESSSDVVFMTDADGVISFINPEFTRLYGFEPEEVIGRTTPRILKSGTLSTDHYEVFWKTLLNKQLVKSEIVNRAKDGNLIVVENSTNVILDESGAIDGFLAIQRDITERKRAEETIAMLGHTIRSISEAVSITDLENYILFVNEAFLRMYGYDEHDLIGQSIEIIRSPNAPVSELQTIFSETRAGGWHGETLNRRKDRTDFPINLSTSIVHDDKGRAIALVGVAQDITERKYAEQVREDLEKQLRQAQKLESLGTLAGGIAHDFNNILGIILGHVTLLKAMGQRQEKFDDRVEVIERAAERGAALVRQLLTFARKTDVVMEPVRINDSVTEVSKLIAETFPKTVVMTVRLEPGLPVIEADANQIHQVLVNLCVNARDAMPGGGELSITTKLVSGKFVRPKFFRAQAREYIQITVADTGTGIDETTRSRIFEPFFTTKAVGKGTGLGLAVVFGIVKSHNGFIDVRSELRRGTSFDLFLPVESQHSESPKQKEGDHKVIGGGSETILLVEDEVALRDMVKDVLNESGYTVFTATDGTEAVEMYAKHWKGIDLVITDVGLPKLDGKEVYVQMRALNAEIKAIVASGYLDPEMKSGLLAAGATYFLHKPYKPREVLATVRTVLDL